MAAVTDDSTLGKTNERHISREWREFNTARSEISAGRVSDEADRLRGALICIHHFICIDIDARRRCHWFIKEDESGAFVFRPGQLRRAKQSFFSFLYILHLLLLLLLHLLLFLPLFAYASFACEQLRDETAPSS